MTTFTAEAQQLFDSYLQTVRWSVRGVADVDEIERDVREHVSSALETQEEPVSSQTLREVLSRLGDPWQWIPLEDMPLWRRLTMRFALGPEDWRLAYATFALTVLGMLLLPVGIGMVLIVAAYFLGRATYALVTDRDGTLGPRKWLVYPPLVFWAITLAMALLIGPVPPLLAWGIGEKGFAPFFKPCITSYAGEGLVLFGGWWIIASGLFAAFPRVLRSLLVPLANNFRRRYALWLTAVGAITLAFGAGLLWVW